MKYPLQFDLNLCELSTRTRISNARICYVSIKAIIINLFSFYTDCDVVNMLTKGRSNMDGFVWLAF